MLVVGVVGVVGVVDTGMLLLPAKCPSTKVAQKVIPHTFSLRNYLCRMYEIHAQCNWMFPLHMLFFHISSFTSAALRQRETRARVPSLYQIFSFSRSHVLTARITLSSPSNLAPRSASFSGPKR